VPSARDFQPKVKNLEIFPPEQRPYCGTLRGALSLPRSGIVELSDESLELQLGWVVLIDHRPPLAAYPIQIERTAVRRENALNVLLVLRAHRDQFEHKCCRSSAVGCGAGMLGDKLLHALLPLPLAALVILELSGAPPPCQRQRPDHLDRLGNRGDTLRSGPIALGLRLPLDARGLGRERDGQFKRHNTILVRSRYALHCRSAELPALMRVLTKRGWSACMHVWTTPDRLATSDGLLRLGIALRGPGRPQKTGKPVMALFLG